MINAFVGSLFAIIVVLAAIFVIAFFQSQHQKVVRLGDKLNEIEKLVERADKKDIK